MNVDQRPDLGLQQHLHLTTELKQGIAILRMSAQELSEYARKCVEENPFFDDDDWVEPRHPLAPERYSQDVSADALFEKRGHGSPETFDAERSDLSQRSFSFDRFLAEGDTLDEHLLEQLRRLDPELPYRANTLTRKLNALTRRLKEEKGIEYWKSRRPESRQLTFLRTEDEEEDEEHDGDDDDDDSAPAEEIPPLPSLGSESGGDGDG